MAELTEAERYVRGWARQQVIIWQEKIERFGIMYSRALYNSFSYSFAGNMAESPTITMRFAAYGIYQAAGTGYGYARDNGGDLEFLDEDYRREHRLDIPRKVGPAWGGYYTSGKPRERRDWYNKKLYASVMALREDMAEIMGLETCYAICDALEDPHAAITGE